MRRNRSADWVRRLTSESSLSANDLIWPMFVQEGYSERTPVPSMPGVERLSIDLAVEATGIAWEILNAQRQHEIIHFAGKMA